MSLLGWQILYKNFTILPAKGLQALCTPQYRTISQQFPRLPTFPMMSEDPYPSFEAIREIMYLTRTANLVT